MSLTHNNSERAKYSYLLQLSQDQIFALESDDLYAFDRILAAKHTLIESLTDARALVKSDPTLAGVIQQIEDRDRAAQRLLYRKVGRIMREMADIQQQKKAGRAYQPPAMSGALSSPALPLDAPRFLDRAS